MLKCLLKNKVDRIRGFGKLISQNEIIVLDKDGKQIESVNADNIIIATGARPKVFPNIPVDRKISLQVQRQCLYPSSQKK
jgi:Pyruvate/2-oxoglutarate dehydrogenase complex, dihydrolipoamide dehydrogenase (E3) component, and related enzymes